MKWLSGVLLGVLVVTHAAHAQDRPIVTLAAPDPPKWDAAEKEFKEAA